MTYSPFLITKSIPDDGFYYFQIARNFAAGAGISSDGIAPTNGFHPLWLFVIAPLWQFFDSKGAINGALVLASLCDTLAALLLYRVVGRLTGKTEIGALGMALYFLNPFSVILALNGLETAINMAAIAFVVDRTLALRNLPAPRLRDFLLPGLALGIAMLARTDNVFLIVGWGLIILFWRNVPFMVRIGGLTIAGSVVIVVTIPWFLWNYLTFGSIMQVSGVALPYLERQLFERENPAARSFAGVWNHFLHKVLAVGIFDNVSRFSGLGRWLNWDAEAIPSAFMVGLLIAGPLAIPESRRLLLRQIGNVTFLLIYCLLFLGYHIGVRWLVREWYILPIAWTIILLLSLSYNALLSLFAERVPWRRLHTVMIAGCCVVLMLHTQKLWDQGMYPWQGGFFTILEETNQLPDGSRVGISDSGFVSYFARHQVVNLDGIVNNQAATAIREGRMMDYLIDSCIDYIYVQPRYLREFFYGSDFEKRLDNQGYRFFTRVKRNPAEDAACYLLPEDGRLNLTNRVYYRYLLDGWSLDEHSGDGVWAMNSRASLRFATEQSGDHLLRFQTVPFSFNGAPEQKITVFVNDAMAGVIALPFTDRFTEYELTIPANLVRDGVNILRFDFAYARSPTEVGYGRDDRILAARFVYIQFTRLTR